MRERVIAVVQLVCLSVNSRRILKDASFQLFKHRREHEGDESLYRAPFCIPIYTFYFHFQYIPDSCTQMRDKTVLLSSSLQLSCSYFNISGEIFGKN